MTRIIRTIIILTIMILAPGVGNRIQEAMAGVLHRSAVQVAPAEGYPAPVDGYPAQVEGTPTATTVWVNYELTPTFAPTMTPEQ